MRVWIYCAVLGLATYFFASPGENRIEDQATSAGVAAKTVTARKIVEPERIPAAEDAHFQAMLGAVRRSLDEARNIPAYTALLEQQVKLDGVVREPDLLDMKLRREPFSVYLRFRGDGQEALYVDGENEGRLLVRPTRGLIALRGVWKLRPDSSQAMKSSRYPITELGIEKLCLQTLQFHERRGFSSGGMRCRTFEEELNGRPVTCFEINFESPATCPEYARSLLKFDGETGLLVSMENDEWTADGTAGDLLERYVYHDFKPAPLMGGEEFQQENPAYHFVRK